jgi:hypothetical protein
MEAMNKLDEFCQSATIWVQPWRIVYKCFLPAAVKGLEGEGGHVMCGS